ncbi:MAG: nucleotidyltransferase domain-containing protein [Nitrososphaeria archaeon]|nr:nucleotidyltransferase domain-containing protein [Nitrososphaeria archaeon]
MNEAKILEGMELKYWTLAEEERHKILEKIKKFFEKDDEIMFAIVHGSFIERNSFRDIDIAIWVKDPEKAFQYTINLPCKIGEEIEVPVDIQVLNDAPLPFKHHVLTSGKILFSRDEKLRTRLADETIRQYMDLKLLTKYSNR